MTEEMLVMASLVLSLLLALRLVQEWRKIVLIKRDLVLQQKILAEKEADLIKTVSEHVRTVEKIIDQAIKDD